MHLLQEKLHKKATARKTEGGEREHTARRKRMSDKNNTFEHSTKVKRLVYSLEYIVVTAPVCHLDRSALNANAAAKATQESNGTKNRGGEREHTPRRKRIVLPSARLNTIAKDVSIWDEHHKH